jgi:hypothetical protein
MTQSKEGASMLVTMDDLPVVESAGRLGRRPFSDSPVADAYAVMRPEAGFLTSAAFTLGLQAVDLLRDQLFPSPEQLRKLRVTSGPNYSTYSDCGPFDYDATCEEPCFGYAPDHMDPFYCATCDEQRADPVNNPAWNWHFVGFRGQIQYKDNEFNPCAGRDAWKWKIEGHCGNCQQSAVFRCHDGYKKLPNSNNWEPTICEGLISCDNKLTLC